ncbi:hypothetical protein LOAG_08214 [Loa loa]|uniref:Protein AATF n=1 Tax=Loa loa TaxID=7209 RepID=A0A1I7VHZ7_LOALO|nr:hypothetical protein LOAG_08214 [Loa loa]EFO20276.2 hypothetical protein LOAG_08214 [Loa loa]
MESLVKEFINSLEGQVAELPDIELADLAEDSKASWTRNKIVENEEADQVEFVKRRITTTQELEGERYGGEKVSSKNVFTGDDISDLAHVRRDTSTESNYDSEDLENEEDSSDSNSAANSSDQESFSADDNVESEVPIEQSQPKKENGAAKGVVTISSNTQNGKAESVRKQLMIWDRLMQLHILSHAALRTFNQLPRDQLAQNLQQSADGDTKKNCRIMRKNLEQLNEIFTTMEDKLLKSSKQTKNLLFDDDHEKRVEDSEDEEIESSIDSDEEDGSPIESDAKQSEGESDVCMSSENITNDNEIVNRDQQVLGNRRKLMPKELMKEYEKRHERFAAFRSSTLSKWDERTTLSNIGIMKNKKKDFSTFESVVLKQIEQIMNEKHRLLRRTQMKRHDVDRIGSDENSNYDAEIFDDDDFYQQLLKELIERKSANVVDPVEMSRQWLEIQKLRQKRSKRKNIDTKASKGRKIRYIVIPKLVNFFPSMAEKATWSHEKRNQLFKSLFSS